MALLISFFNKYSVFIWKWCNTFLASSSRHSKCTMRGRLRDYRIM